MALAGGFGGCGGCDGQSVVFEVVGGLLISWFGARTLFVACSLTVFMSRVVGFEVGPVGNGGRV